MHEQLIDVRTGAAPCWYQPTIANCEVFHDHYHTWFKRLEPAQRAHDVAIYDAIHEGRRPPTQDEFNGRAIELPVPTCAGAA